MRRTMAKLLAFGTGIVVVALAATFALLRTP